MTNKYNVRAYLGIIPIVFALMICIMPFITGNAFAAGGLSGANIKDGVLQGYYGDGGDIVLPNTVTSIAGEAFKNNDNVTSITIPGSVSSIGYSAFEGCTALEKVVFSDPKDGAELTIRVNAFQDCTKLSDITIPACCTYVTANIFKGCTSLEEIKVDEDNPYYASQDGAFFGPWVDEGVPQYDDPNWAIIGYAAGKAPGTYEIPSEVKGHTINMIWASAFNKCENLTGIKIPSSVKDIRGNAFEETGLTEITIPDTVEKIGSSLFAGSKNLTDVTLPDSCEELGYGFFNGCTALQRVKMDGVLSLSMYAFKDCTSLTTLMLPDKLKNIGLSVFPGCTNLQRVFIPESVTSFPSDEYVGAYDIFTDAPAGLQVYVVKGSTGEKYAFNNKDDFGWNYTVVDSKEALKNIDMGEFSLADMGRKIKATAKFNIENTMKVEDIVSGDAYDIFAQKANGKALKVYNISLLPENSKVPNEIVLAIAVPNGIISKNSELYTLSGASVEKINTTISSKTHKGTVSGFGYFAVIGDADTSVVPDKPVEAESVTLNKESASVKEGKSLVLTSTVLPENTTDKSITWSSSDESVATVASTGVVKGIKAGKAIITATTSNGKTAQCEIRVTDAAAIEADEISFAAQKKLNDNGEAVFNLNLKDATRIADVSLTFNTSSKDVKVEGANGFQLLGELKTSVSGEESSYTVVLAYLGEDRLFEGAGSNTIANVIASGDEPYVEITEAKIAGWGSDEVAKYGTIDNVDKSKIEYKALSPYDFNEDSKVDIEDLNMAKAEYMTSSEDNNYKSVSNYDVNSDGVINIADFVEISANFTE